MCKQSNLFKKSIATTYLCFQLLFFTQPAWAELTISAEKAVKIEVIGFSVFSEEQLFEGQISVNDSQRINLPYRGLALLRFTSGQNYPVIITDENCSLNILSPTEPPQLLGCQENSYFYRALKGDKHRDVSHQYATVMIQARELLDSSSTIRSLKDLREKKEEFTQYVKKEYALLKNSDMISRLLKQFFMMHEYADYSHGEKPVSTIKTRYQEEIVDGVGVWIELLSTHIPEHEILNYIVSIYYNRSMITLASHIMNNFQKIAFCPGIDRKTFEFPDDFAIKMGSAPSVTSLEASRQNTTVSFVSLDCPVSLVRTISTVRQWSAERKNSTMVVVPFEPLSDSHMAMARMLSSGNMFFVNDEAWRQEHLKTRLRLPLLVPLVAPKNQ